MSHEIKSVGNLHEKQGIAVRVPLMENGYLQVIVKTIHFSRNKMRSRYSGNTSVLITQTLPIKERLLIRQQFILCSILFNLSLKFKQ